MSSGSSHLHRMLAPTAFLVMLVAAGFFLHLYQGKEVDVEDRSLIYPLYYAVLALAFVYCQCWLFRVVQHRSLLLKLFVFWKLPLSCSLVYLLIHRWQGGDFESYFNLPVTAIQGYHTYDLPTTWGNGTMMASFLIYCIFRVLPVSLYGLAFLFAALSFSAYVIIYKVFEPYVKSTGQLLLVLFGLPSVTIQSGYVGKDGLTLFLTAVIFYCLVLLLDGSGSFRGFFCLLVLIIGLMGINLLRAYQATMIGMAIYTFAVLRSRLTSRIVLLIGAGMLAWVAVTQNWLQRLLWTYEEERLSFEGLISALAATYDGASLMLRPFPFPFQFLQVFRPFPWEANNLLALVSSWEMGLIFLFCVGRLMLGGKQILRNFRSNPLYLFLLCYTAIFITAFSFSSNMGDLSRRRVYFICFLLILLLPVKERRVEAGRELAAT